MEYFNVVLKTIIFYVLLILIIRMLGKREVGEISVFDLVVILIIADVATLGINNGWREVLISGLSLLTLLGLQKLFAFLTLYFPKIRNIVDYKPSIIIYDGKINLEEMKKQAYTIDDLITQARNKGIMDLNEIRLAILESDGELSVYEKNEYEKEILPVIISGVYQEDNIKILKLSKLEINLYLETNELKLKQINYLSSDGSSFYQIKIL